MDIVMGATGHVGSAVANALLEAGRPVGAITRNASRAARLAARGARIFEVDLHDADALRAVFRHGSRAFLLNPPADIAGDTNAGELATAGGILSALGGSGLERVVLQSTYGAQACEDCGDLGILYRLEQGVRSQAVPWTLLRAAYLMSNWDAPFQVAARTGRLPTFYPAALKLPMVAPADMGLVAAHLLQVDASIGQVVHVEGPQRYSSDDVARALSAVLSKPVTPEVAPRESWPAVCRELGFSEAATRSFVGMTTISVDGTIEVPQSPIRGRTSLRQYLYALNAAASREAVERRDNR